MAKAKTEPKEPEDIDTDEPASDGEEKKDIEDILAEPAKPDSDEDLDLEEVVAEPEEEADAKASEKPEDSLELDEPEKPEPKKEDKEPEKDEEKLDLGKPMPSEAEVTGKDKKKRKLWATIAIVFVTVLVTAAAVLGVVWWFYRSGTAKKADTPAETKTEEPAAVETPTENAIYVTAAGGLNLRKEPSATSQQLALIPYGTKLLVLETQGEWTKTTYQNQTGWVFTQFTTKIKPFDVDWKTYTGTGFSPTGQKFSIKYPTDWTLDGYKISKVDAGITYKIALGEGGHGMTEGDDVTASTVDATYNGLPAKKSTVKKAGIIVFIGVNFVGKDANQPTQIEMWVPEGYNPTYLDTFEKILSTIVFP